MREFLIEAKKNTYASIGAARTASTRSGSTDYHYESLIGGKKMVYHDTYFGGNSFIGEEIVYDKKPVWGMNYYGYLLSSDFVEVFDLVLRPALMLVGTDKMVLPLRGPSKLTIGEYVYTFKTTGSLERFNGVERIYIKGKLVYELFCRGGTLI